MVSIIVPAYNAEKTLERCLCSLKNQTYKNIEVLVVNDGSQDHTRRIVDKYRKKDSRFRLINKTNSGVSDSRNAGMEEAAGEYLQFADADDWLPKNAVEAFVTRAVGTGCDMVIADFYRVVGKRIYVKGHIPKEGLLSRDDFAAYMMKAPANFYYGVMWNKFFKADIVRERGLSCKKEMSWCEDFLFNLEYLESVSSIYVCKEPVYYYVKTKGSLVSTQVNLSQTIKTKKILFDYYKELYQSIDMYEENKFRIQLFLLDFARDTGKRKKKAQAT